MGQRLFVGIPLSESIRQQMEPLISAFGETGADYKHVPPEQLHVTVKFVGEVDEQSVPSLMERLGKVTHQFHHFTISIQGVGVFPNLQRINVIWVGVHHPQLLSLMKEINRTLNDIRPAEHEKTPHITVARMKSGKNKLAVQQVIQQWQDYSFGEMLVEKIVLYESQLTPSGPVYRSLKEFILA